MPYPHRNVELLLAIAGVMVFTGIWLPIVKALRGWGPWFEIPAASVPLLLLIAVCVIFWRRSRE